MLNKKAGNLSGTSYKEFLSRPRYLQRTPEWTEPTAKKDLGSNQIHDMNLNAESHGLSDLRSRIELTTQLLGSAHKKILAAAVTKTKVKSRGIQGSSLVVSMEVRPASEKLMVPNPHLQ
jgi:hypothetical protein